MGNLNKCEGAMFRENKKYQVSLFGMVYQLSLGVKKMLDEIWALQ